jgi:3-oxoacyl-[acyl-carrier protein] reductase
MEGPYAGKVALVTGARKGLGLLIANHFLAQGATVVGFSRGPQTFSHPSYKHIVCDVCDEIQVRESFAGLESRLDILVNNAGILSSQHSLLMSSAAAKEMLMTNLLGPLLVSREAARLMKKSGGGRIINIGSMAAVLAPVGDSIYAATKAGLVTMTNVLAKEFARFKVTCNTIGVTAIETDMLKQLPAENISKVIAQLTLPRLAEPDDIFNVIDFLASERSSYITAQSIYLGGLH